MVATVLPPTTIFGFPLVVAALRRFSRHSPNSRSVRYDFHRGEAREQEISTTHPCGSQIVGLPPCSTNTRNVRCRSGGKGQLLKVWASQARRVGKHRNPLS